MVQFSGPATERSTTTARSKVPLLQTSRSDLVMLYESKLRWAGIEYNTEFLDSGSQASEAAPHKELRVSVPAERLEEARRLLQVLDDEVL